MITKMAQVVVDYSLNIKPGDLVWLMGDLEGLPLFEAIYKEVVKSGGHVMSSIIPPRFEELFFTHASEQQLKFTPPDLMYKTEICTKRVRIIAPSNTRALSNVDPRKQAMVGQSRGKILKTMLDRSAKGEVDWVVTLCPTQALAQEANMGLSEYEQFVYKAAHLDEDDPVAYLRSMEKQQQKLIDVLKDKKELHFQTSSGTDLLVNVERMHWMNSCGKRNFPDGEVFTGPNLSAKCGGVNGVVRYTFPAIWQNTVVEDVELTFEKGEVVSAKAASNEHFLNEIIGQDAGAKRLGEIAIGTNEKISKFTQNILFDEKIGGTFHAALGMGYPETGNTNQSSLHWDMICDLREGGTIHGDGQLISQDGVLVI